MVALAVIFFGLQVYGITVPCTTEHDQTTWHEVIIIHSTSIFFSLLKVNFADKMCKFLFQTFHASAKKDDIWAVLEKIMDFYEQDKGMK